MRETRNLSSANAQIGRLPILLNFTKLYDMTVETTAGTLTFWTNCDDITRLQVWG